MVAGRLRRSRSPSSTIRLPGADDDEENGKTPPPIVIDRFYFKEDETGYLDSRRTHLYLLDAESGEVQTLTSGRFNEQYASWSPDGTQLAFMSKRAADPDRSNQFGLYVMSAQPGASARLVTSFAGDSGDSGWMSQCLVEPRRQAARVHRCHRSQAHLLRAEPAAMSCRQRAVLLAW